MIVGVDLSSEGDSVSVMVGRAHSCGKIVVDHCFTGRKAVLVAGLYDKMKSDPRRPLELSLSDYSFVKKFLSPLSVPDFVTCREH